MTSHHAPTTEEAVAARRREVEGHVGTHGHSVAAWTGVGVCLLGALVAAFAVIFAVVWLFAVGLVIMAASGPITMVMSRARRGRPHPHQSGKPTGAVR